jgi:hypothetical protein
MQQIPNSEQGSIDIKQYQSLHQNSTHSALVQNSRESYPNSHTVDLSEYVQAIQSHQPDRIVGRKNRWRLPTLL